VSSTGALRKKSSNVKGHQDDGAKRSRLAFEAQLNCYCDDLAKEAITAVILDNNARGTEGRQPLPLEQARVYLGDEKQTTDLAKTLRFHVGRAQARDFYASEDVMTNATFDTVCWEDLHHTLEKKPKMYQLWYGKQGSGFCGTGEMLKRWKEDESGLCPNCGREEDAGHLNRCGNPNRRRLLSSSIDELTDWMEGHHTHPELAHWIPLYL